MTLLKAVSNKDKVVLVDFYAECVPSCYSSYLFRTFKINCVHIFIYLRRWCNPCKMLSPILEKLTEDSSVKTGSGKPLDLVTVDTDSEVELAQQFQIRSLPTVIAFKDGKPVSQFMGAMPEPSVRNFLQTL
ncbi:unnamed protein product [Somion occarium]|uniref:Thioredoxin n=1 Tax=Somion occarium TaxID=3059160 RepID=A0ABP1DDS0_9APHY